MSALGIGLLAIGLAVISATWIAIAVGASVAWSEATSRIGWLGHIADNWDWELIATLTLGVALVLGYLLIN